MGLPWHSQGASVQSLGTRVVTVSGISENFKSGVYMISVHPSLSVRPWPQNLPFQFNVAEQVGLAYYCGVESKRMRDRVRPLQDLGQCWEQTRSDHQSVVSPELLSQGQL